jgi:hypothetical protein
MQRLCLVFNPSIIRPFMDLRSSLPPLGVINPDGIVGKLYMRKLFI